MNSSIDQGSKLCHYCRTHVFGRQAWAKLWGEPGSDSEASLKYTVTREALLVSLEAKCQFCNFIYGKSGNGGNLSICVQLRYTAGVRPKKINQLVLVIRGALNQLGRYHYVGLFTKSDDIASFTIRAPAERKEAAFNFDSGSAIEWIRECQLLHPECCRQNRYRLPTRVLDVITHKSSTVKLKTTESGDSEEYIALSYCWGTSRPFITTSSTLKSHQEGINIDRMPRTIQDAVRVTQDLGVKYLWIDALCIVQDSAGDLLEEMSRMRLYYENALVVIAASGASDVQEGFLNIHQLDDSVCNATPAGLGPGRSQAIEVPYYSPAGEEGKVFLDLSTRWYEPAQEPLNQRAWTLQERLLCPRVLVFPSQGGFLLQCEREQRHDDSIVFGHQSSTDRIFLFQHSKLAEFRDNSSSQNLYESWLMLVRDYSGRKISVVGDKFNAIAGIVDAYQTRFGKLFGDYLAGHWSNYLLESLHWYVQNSSLRPAEETVRPPSWSWLSVDSQVIPLSRLILRQNYVSLAEVQFYGVRLVSERLPFGPVQQGSLSMKAMIGTGRWVPGNNHEYSSALEVEGGGRCIERAIAMADTMANFPAKPTEVFFLPLCSAGPRPALYGLLLQRIVPSYENLFRRIGYFIHAPQGILNACMAAPSVTII